MPSFTGPYLMDPPTAPLVAPGLFDVALGPMSFPVPEAVGGGVLWVPDSCDTTTALIDMTCPPITGAKSFTAVEFPVSGAPFTVMTSYTCTPIGFDFAEAERRVRLRMALREQRAVEQRLWSGSTGVLGTIPALFASATTVGPAGCPTEAIELLEGALATAGISQGIIHARTAMTPHLSNNLLISNPGPDRVKYTPNGTRYVFGQGYTGVGPTGQSVGTDTEWMYATGRVVLFRDEIFVPDAGQVLNKSTNQLSLVAERAYAAVIECGIWAVQVTRSCTTSGGGT
jgi:hypothetical protein